MQTTMLRSQPHSGLAAPRLPARATLRPVTSSPLSRGTAFVRATFEAPAGSAAGTGGVKGPGNFDAAAEARKVEKIDQGAVFTDASGTVVKQAFGGTPSATRGDLSAIPTSTFKDAAGTVVPQIGGGTYTPPPATLPSPYKSTPTPIGGGPGFNPPPRSGGGGGGSGGSSGKGPQPSGSSGSGDNGGLWQTLKVALGVSAVLFALSLLYKRFQGQVDGTAEHAKDKVVTKVNTAQAKHKAHNAKSSAADAVHNAGAAVRHGVDEVKHKASEVKHAASDATHAAGAKISNAVHHGEHKAEHKVERAKEAAHDAHKEAAHEGKGVLDSVKDAVSNVAHKVQGGVESTEAKAKNRLESVKKAFKAEDGSVAKAPIYGAVGATIGAGLLAAAYWWDKNHNDTFGKGVDKATRAASRAADKASRAAQKAANKATGKANKAADQVSKGADRVKEDLNNPTPAASGPGAPAPGASGNKISVGPGYANATGGPSLPKQ